MEPTSNDDKATEDSKKRCSSGDMPREKSSKKMATSETKAPRRVIVDLNAHDVVCGRGPIVHFEGNKRFRELIRPHKTAFMSTGRHRAKKELSSRLYDELASRGGRFVRKVSTLEEAQELGVPVSDEINTVWVEIEKTEALRKIKQALREKDAPNPLAIPTFGTDESPEVPISNTGTTSEAKVDESATNPSSGQLTLSGEELAPLHRPSTVLTHQGGIPVTVVYATTTNNNAMVAPTTLSTVALAPLSSFQEQPQVPPQVPPQQPLVLPPVDSTNVHVYLQILHQAQLNMQQTEQLQRNASLAMQAQAALWNQSPQAHLSPRLPVPVTVLSQCPTIMPMVNPAMPLLQYPTANAMHVHSMFPSLMPQALYNPYASLVATAPQANTNAAAANATAALAANLNRQTALGAVQEQLQEDSGLLSSHTGSSNL